jgi:hypothetical protein
VCKLFYKTGFNIPLKSKNIKNYASVYRFRNLLIYKKKNFQCKLLSENRRPTDFDSDALKICCFFLISRPEYTLEYIYIVYCCEIYKYKLSCWFSNNLICFPSTQEVIHNNRHCYLSSKGTSYPALLIPVEIIWENYKGKYSNTSAF